MGGTWSKKRCEETQQYGGDCLKSVITIHRTIEMGRLVGVGGAMEMTKAVGVGGAIEGEWPLLLS